jgi:hypothetical protein
MAPLVGMTAAGDFPLVNMRRVAERWRFADPKLKARLVDLGGTVLPGSPADFSKLIVDETEKWGKVIRAANIKA